jgi:hypothetical protein
MGPAMLNVEELKKGRAAVSDKPRIDLIIDERVDTSLPFASHKLAEIVQAMQLTGMQAGEALTMTSAEIDRTDPTCWVYRPGHH